MSLTFLPTYRSRFRPTTAVWGVSLLILLLVGVSTSAQSQTSDELKDKRARLLTEIKTNTRRLGETRKNKEEALVQLAILQDQIQKREELIATVQQEIANTNANIDRTAEVVTQLGEDVARLQTEYSHLLRAAWRARLQNSWLTFLLSSNSFNQAFKRWQYMRQYQRFRTRQAKLVLATKQTLEKIGAVGTSKRQEKETLLQAEENQKVALAREKTAKDNLVGKLKTSESDLLATLKKQEAAKAALNQAIEQAIASEMERVRRSERRTSTPSGTQSKPTTPAVGTGFAGLRGSLPWPVEGTVSRRFGRQPHPSVKGVEITNNGIDIRPSGNTAVKSVAEGIVASIHYVPGYENMVLIRHGEYYTVYSNIETVTVSSDDKLTAGQVLGHLANNAELHFEVWHLKERKNPESWIRK
ncbi:MAG: peptidoglycan DD-metalloendopeptidase family protein [Saprospiraceae bacterium]